MTTYFITISAHKQRDLFQGDGVAELMVATFLKQRDAGEFELHEYVVLPNHVHLLLSIKGQQRLGQVIHLIKSGFSHSLRLKGTMLRAVWEEKYHYRRVRDDREFAEFVRYIRLNPVQKGLAERPEEYAYSSAARVPAATLLVNERGYLDADPSAGSGQALKVSANGPSKAGDAKLKVRSVEFLETPVTPPAES